MGPVLARTPAIMSVKPREAAAIPLLGQVTGKVALITGAGRGIGRATALALAERGAKVMAVARTESDLISLPSAIGITHLAESVASIAACERIVDETHRRLGPVDILVNNAGIGSGDERSIWEQETAVWEQTLAVNLHGPFQLTRLASRDMVDRGWGRIVMVASTAAEVGGPEMSAYSASKAGVLGLMRSVAHDVGPFGVTCNAVLPGWVRTEMAERSAMREARQRGIAIDDVWAERAAQYPAGRVVREEEVASAISFLVSESASGINGASLNVTLGGAW